MMTPPNPPGRLARKSRFANSLAHGRDLVARRWRVLALGGVAALLVQAALARWTAPGWASVGQMIVNVKLSIPEGSLFTEELGNFLGTQAALMQSDLVLNRAFVRAAAAAEGTNAPTERPVLTVGLTPRTTIFNLRATGSEPSFTRLFLQAAMEEYIRLKREMRKQASDATVASLSEELLSLENQLRRAQDEIARFQESNSVAWLEHQGNALPNYLASLNQRLETCRSEYDLLQTLTLDEDLQRQDLAWAIPSTPAGPDAAPTNSPPQISPLASDYLKARQELLLLKADRDDLGQFLRPKHPKMVAMQEEIARRERLLEIYRQQNVEQLQARKRSAALRLRGLEKEAEDWNSRIVEIGRKSAEYQRLKGNAERIQSLHQQLLGTVQTLDANKEVGAETVSIMEPASPPFLDTRKRRNQLLLAGLASVAATIALLLFLDRLDDRVNSLAELQELFDDPVLAQIPRVKHDNGTPRLIHAGDPRHAFLEAYRNLRSSILYLPEPGKRPRTLLLTSTIPEEGKSVTAANLALALAAGGARVLLVDADLRKGVLHQRFAFPDTAGLSEALARNAPWRDFVRPTAAHNLWLLPRGSITSASGELFLRAAARQLLKEAADEYDFVLLDTPPVMAADDATTLAPHANAVLFILRAGHTSARVAHAALDLLFQRNARVLGIVFNAVRAGSPQYYYYQYRNYHVATAAGNGVSSGEPATRSP